MRVGLDRIANAIDIEFNYAMQPDGVKKIKLHRPKQPPARRDVNDRSPPLLAVPVLSIASTRLNADRQISDRKAAGQ